MATKAQLEDVFDQIKGNSDLARQFTENPQQVLQSLGVDPSTVTIQAVPMTTSFVQLQDNAAKDAEQPLKLGAAADVTVCGSVGCVACVSVG
jgi:hypothetical protein